MKTRWRAVGRLTDADPRRVDGFALQGRLGQGGMGVVYLGEHAQLGPAAIKFVHAAIAADPTFRARFRREVEAADRVASVRVARVLGADVDAQVPWLATAFVDGPTLSEAVGDGNPMAGDRLLALAAALADALTAIHRAGVVHRDLKPSNILLTPSTPVVIDFGIAAAHEQTELTRTGMQLGTPGWMAPEQVRGRRAGPATDVFAWGMVVAYAASGRPPFGRGPADALYYRVVHQRPHLPEGLPAPLDALVPAALVKDPRQRPSVADLVTGLEAGVWPLRPDTADNGAEAGTDAPTTGSVPTIVAAGWGPEALPPVGPRPPVAPTEATRNAVPTTAGTVGPDAGAAGNGSRQPGDGAAAAAAGAVTAATAMGPRASAVPGGTLRRPDATLVAPPAGPTFFYAGAEHDDPASLAAALGREWDDAVDQLFVTRDPIWISDLRTFLRARGLAEAEVMVAKGRVEDEPVAATMARLLTAIDRDHEPVMGDLLLTPAGLATAAQVVVAGKAGAGRTAARLGDVRSARLLRLWRNQPGMEHAAGVDERWQAATHAYERLAPTVAGQAGSPAPGDDAVASARLLLCAVGGRYERQQARQLRSARRTSAVDAPWWRQLADQGGGSAAATALALVTAERAKAAGAAARQEQAARYAQAEQARRAAAAAAAQRPLPPSAVPKVAPPTAAQRPVPPVPPVAPVAPRPAPPSPSTPPAYRPPPPGAPAANRPAPPPAAARAGARQRPTPNARPFVASALGMVVTAVILVGHLWTLARLGPDLEALYEGDGGVDFLDSERAYGDVRSATGFVILMLLLSLAFHVATRAVDAGKRPAVVRAYALGSAALDGFLSLAFFMTVSLAVLVVQATAQGPFTNDVATIPARWAMLMFTHGAVAVLALWIGVRAVVRFPRALFGGTVGYPVHHPVY